MNYKLWLMRLLLDEFAWNTEMAVTGVGDIDSAIPEQLTNAPFAVM